VGREEVESSGNAEADAAHERVWEPYASQVEISVREQESADVRVRIQERDERLAERW
jgi:hypothetical protein